MMLGLVARLFPTEERTDDSWPVPNTDPVFLDHFGSAREDGFAGAAWVLLPTLQLRFLKGVRTHRIDDDPLGLFANRAAEAIDRGENRSKDVLPVDPSIQEPGAVPVHPVVSPRRQIRWPNGHVAN